MKQIICVDFDGVLHEYKSKYESAITIPDGPVAGAAEWCHEMVKTFDIVICSSRARYDSGVCAIMEWLDKYGFPTNDIKVTHEKPPATVYIDDRGWRFEGSFPSAELILSLKPWNK